MVVVVMALVGVALTLFLFNTQLLVVEAFVVEFLLFVVELLPLEEEAVLLLGASNTGGGRLLPLSLQQVLSLQEVHLLLGASTGGERLLPLSLQQVLSLQEVHQQKVEAGAL